MAKILSAYDLDKQWGMRKHWAYNGTDCCVTREVFDVLYPRLDDLTRRTYEFELACQAPALTMTLRGVMVDEGARSETLDILKAEERAKRSELGSVLAPVWDKLERRKGKCTDGKNHKWPRGVEDSVSSCGKCGAGRLVASDFNPLSVPQVKKAVYSKLGLPVQIHRKTKLPTVDDEALSRLALKYPAQAPFLNAILEARGVRKQIGFLNSRVSVDGRLRASFNVGAAETGRWSSSKSAFMEGTNFQNIADRSRNIFVCDPGLVLFYADLEQAESRCVAYDAEDEAYIAAHESGDVHTAVARMLWPEFAWTGDIVKDKEIAEQPTPWDAFHPYRYFAKIVQHGTNIGMTPVGIAREAHIKIADAEDVQRRYFQAFKRVAQRQREIRAQVRQTGRLVTPLGRKRQFFGRLWDESTQKEALAQTQQSMIGDILNVALWRVWEELDTKVHTIGHSPHPSDPNKVWLIAQVHDAILGEIRQGDAETLARVKELMSIPVSIRGRTMTVPVEILVGKTWRKSDMKKWKGGPLE